MRGSGRCPVKCQQCKLEDLSLHPRTQLWESPGAVVAGCSQVALWSQPASQQVSFRVSERLEIGWRKTPEVDFWLPQHIYTEVHSLTSATFTHLHTSAHTYVVKEE